MAKVDGKFKNLNAVFNAHVNKKFDRAFMSTVLTHVANFVRKDENSILFFGGNLIGVYPVKWLMDDKLSWINDVLEITDYDKLCSDIYDLPSINKSWQIASDAVNLSFMWVAHQALVSEFLTPVERGMLAHAAFNMLQYKFISSIHTHYFKFSADIEVALAVYENLDNKSQLKKAGTWQGLIDSRSTDILGVDGLHSKTIRTFENDTDIIKMVNDIWNRIKSIFNIITRDFYHIRDTKAKIASANKFMNIDGEAILKDYVNKYAYIKGIMHYIIPDKNAFIREDLLNVTALTITTVYPEYLKSTLNYMVENFSAKHKDVNIPELVDDILMFAFNILREDKIELDNLSVIAIKLRGILRSSRIISPEYKNIKDKLAVIIENANYKILEVNVASTRIAIILYIVLRALIKT